MRSAAPAAPAALALLRTALLAAALVSTLVAAACTQRAPASDRPVVVVSVLPQAWFVERITGGVVDVEVLIPPGASPHSHEPTVAQMRALSRAHLLLTVGHPRFPFERAWLPRLTDGRDDLRVVNSTEGVTYDPHDPHVWTSPAAGRVIAANVCDALVELLPDHAEVFRGNLTSTLAEIDGLDVELAAALRPFEGRMVFVFHPAWGYLLGAYGVRQIAVERDGKEPGAESLAAVARSARRANVRVIFVQPQSSTRSAETVAREVGATLVVVDPLAADWPSNLRAVAAAFREALEP